MIAAIVPAAGLSSRMGRPKLLLEIASVPLIQRVVRALIEGGVDRVLVVLGPAAQEGAIEVARVAKEAGASIESLETPTADMRATIERGIDSLSATGLIPIGLMIVPADSVGLCSELVREVAGRFRSDPERIVVPIREGRRGHPLLLPWTEALQICRLPANVGVNALLARRSEILDLFPVAIAGLDADLDTPEDYVRWSNG
jgi:molybdenum cofactor cytidylyltransferase